MIVRFMAAVAVTAIGLQAQSNFIVVGPGRMTFRVAADTLLEGFGQLRGARVNPAFLGAPDLPFKLTEIRVDRSTGDPEGKTNFVVVSPTSGVTPMSLYVGLNPNIVPYMRTGVYSLTVLFNDPVNPRPFSGGISVDLVITGSGPPAIEAVVHAASLQPGISPGQLVTIRGTRLSTPPLTGEPDSAGQFPTLLGNSRIMINGVAAPILYVSNTQINCVAPNSIKGSRTAEVVVERPYPSGTVIRSQPVTVPVQDTLPGIFTSDASGSGVAAGVPGESNPAPKGSVITFYATGAGVWEIPYPDGALVLSDIHAFDNKILIPAAPVSVTIGGQPAKVIQAGRMPRQVSGMLMVKAEVPQNAGSGEQPITLTIGERDNSAQRVTVWVK